MVKVAVMVAVPAAAAVATPVLLTTVATVVSDEVQLTTVVISKVVLSENVPVALN